MGKEYSEEYKKIKQEAETKWPRWKIDSYNNCIAISKHAKKIKRTI